jgi:hypothetical protein
MKTLRVHLLLLVLLLLSVPAVGAESYGSLMARAAKLLGSRSAPKGASAAELRAALATLPREELSDGDWLDLHIVLAALDRRIHPVAEVAPPPPPETVALGEVPGQDSLPDGAGPVALLDLAARCHRLEPRPGAGPVPPDRRIPFQKAAKLVEDLGARARGISSPDPLAAAAARVLARTARDLAFDLACAGRGSGACGGARFEWRLRRDHGLDLTVEQVREIGRSARQRILAEMQALAHRIDPARTWQQITEDSRRDHPQSSEDLLAFCRTATADAIRASVASGLVTVPPAARHPGFHLIEKLNPGYPTPFACYNPGRAVAGRYLGGSFAVAGLPSGLDPDQREAWLRGRDFHWLRIICGHETVPGHHLQFERASGVRSPFRHFGYTSVYVEGWGLNSEDLLDRAGAYRDPLDRLALLRMRLWRADRVLIDVGLSTGTMRPSAAVSMLVEEIRMDRWSAEREVERYLVSPTQPLSYLIGYEKISAIRRAWLAGHGPDSEKEFNDRLLSFGPIPLDLAAAVLLDRRRAYDSVHP